MESLALLNRPELHELAYQGRISGLQARKEVLRLFSEPESVRLDQCRHERLPGASGLGRSWRPGELEPPERADAAGEPPLREAQTELDQTRRLALSMAVLAQTHVGYQQFMRAREQYEQAAQLSSIDGRIYQTVRTDAAGAA